MCFTSLSDAGSRRSAVLKADRPRRERQVQRGQRSAAHVACEERPADDRRLGAGAGELEHVVGRADAARGEHGEARGRDRGDELEIGAGERPVPVDRGAEDARARPPRGRARPPRRARGRSRPSSRTCAPMPSRTSSATTSRSPSAAAHGAGSGKAAVPTTRGRRPRRAAPAASASDRIPPEAWRSAGATASATSRTSSGRTAAGAGAVEVDEVDPAARRRRRSAWRARPGRRPRSTTSS